MGVLHRHDARLLLSDRHPARASSESVVSGMEKARQAFVHMEMVDDHCEGEIRGDGNAIANTMLSVMIDASKDKDVRRLLRDVCRVYLRKTSVFTGVIEYVRGKWLGGVIGAAVIAGAIYAASWVAHLVGVV